jgi:hypothetical protein
MANNPDYSWVGTAWLVDKDIAVTNRHVASVFAVQKGEKFIFRTAPGFSEAMASSVDFQQSSPAVMAFSSSVISPEKRC